MLTLDNLTIGYQSPLMTAINCRMQEGEFIALLGRNGTGKTTLIRTIFGFQTPLAGEIFIQKIINTHIDAAKRAQLISLVSTERLQTRYFKVSDVLELGRQPYTNYFGKLTEKDEEIIRNIVEQVDLECLLDKTLEQLSDGERQKVMIGRALVQDTPIVLLDEPTAHLDLVNRFEIFQLLKKLCKTTSKLIILATHEVELALATADKILLFDNQNQHHFNTPKVLIDKSVIRKTFEKKGIRFDEKIMRFVIENA